MGASKNRKRKKTCRVSRPSRSTASIETIPWPAASVQVGPYLLPAGEYWLGDLCNVLSDVEWNEIGGRQGHIKLNSGRIVVVFKLPQGRGVYPCKTQRLHIIDSGTVGITAMRNLQTNGVGQVLNYTHDFYCTCVTTLHPDGGGYVSFNEFGTAVQIDSDDRVDSISQFVRDWFAAEYH
jgi:hypothetical protein